MTAEFLTYANIVINIGFAIVVLWIYMRYNKSCGNKLIDIKNRLHMINEELAQISVGYSNSYSGTKLQKVRDAFAKDEELNRLWRLFDKTLISKTIHTGNADIKEYYATTDVENYISFATVSNSINIGFWQNVGGIFTGIGIFGTFLGLTLGLAYVGSHEINVESMSVLMGGLGTAFITSLLGVSAALAFNYYHKQYTEGLQREADCTLGYLEDIFQRLSTEQILADIYESTEEQTEEIQTFTNKLAVSIREELTKSDFAENIQNVDNEITNIREFLQKELSNVISTSISTQLNPIFKELQASITKLSNSGLDAVAEGIQNSAGKELGAFAQTIQSLNNNITETLTELQSTSGSVKEDLTDSIANVIEKLDKSSKALQVTSDSVANDLKSCVEQILQKIGEQQQNATSKNDEIMKKTQDEMVKVLAAMQTNVNEIKEQTAIQIAGINEQTSAQRESLVATSNSVNTAVASSMETIRQQVNEMMQSFNEKNKESNNNISSLINRLKDDLLIQQDTLNNINTTVSNLIDKASNTADKFGQAAKPIERASDNLAAQFQKTIDATDKYSNSVEEGIGKLKEIAEINTNGIKDISDEFEKTRKSMHQSAEEYNGVNAQLTEILKSIDVGLKNYNTQILEIYKQSLEAYAEQIANACGQLASITEDLTDSIDENFGRR